MKRCMVCRCSGGKRVKVCLAVEEGRVTRVEMSGDFFLSPEYMLDDLAECLEGLSVGEALNMLRLAVGGLGRVVEAAGASWDEIINCLVEVLKSFLVGS